MRSGLSLFWLPVRLLWSLMKAAALPAVVVGVSWWLFPDRWAQIVTGVAVLYLAGVVLFVGATVRGQVRSMSRGTFTIRDAGRWDR